METLLRKWVNQDSPTYDKHAVDAMGRLIAQEFVEAGAALEATYPQSEWGDHFKVSFGQGDRQIVILCHFDKKWTGPGSGRARHERRYGHWTVRP
jgi:glutamate carboxypeptidase